MMMTGTSLAYQLLLGTSTCVHQFGVGSIKKIFGARKRRGTRPSHFCETSGSVARKALQTLEQLKLVEKAPNGGRILTSQGHRDLDRIAAQMKKVKAAPQPIIAPVV